MSKRNVGIGMLLGVFCGIFINVWLDVGFISALGIFALATFINAIIVGAVFLIFSD